MVSVVVTFVVHIDYACSMYVRSQTAALSPCWKHGALRPQKPLRLIRDGEVGGSGFFNFF